MEDLPDEASTRVRLLAEAQRASDLFREAIEKILGQKEKLGSVPQREVPVR